MQKEPIVAKTQPLLTEPTRAETPVRIMPLEKAKKLIRKTSARNAELFRRLAK